MKFKHRAIDITLMDLSSNGNGEKVSSFQTTVLCLQTLKHLPFLESVVLLKPNQEETIHLLKKCSNRSGLDVSISDKSDSYCDKIPDENATGMFIGMKMYVV